MVGKFGKCCCGSSGGDPSCLALALAPAEFDTFANLDAGQNLKSFSQNSYPPYSIFTSGADFRKAEAVAEITTVFGRRKHAAWLEARWTMSWDTSQYRYLEATATATRSEPNVSVMQQTNIGSTIRLETMNTNGQSPNMLAISASVLDVLRTTGGLSIYSVPPVSAELKIILDSVNRTSTVWLYGPENPVTVQAWEPRAILRDMCTMVFTWQVTGTTSNEFTNNTPLVSPVWAELSGLHIHQRN